MRQRAWTSASARRATEPHPCPNPNTNCSGTLTFARSARGARGPRPPPVGAAAEHPKGVGLPRVVDGEFGRRVVAELTQHSRKAPGDSFAHRRRSGEVRWRSPPGARFSLSADYAGYAGSGGGTCLGGPGTPCTDESQCCQVDTNGDTCVGGPINQCAALCYSSSDCPSDCCVALQDESYGACVSVSGYTCMP